MFTDGAGHGRGRHRLAGTGVGGATVPQLLEDFRAVHVHPACQLVVEREDRVGEHRDGGGRARLHACDLDDREADTTSGAFLVVRDQVLAGGSGGVGRACDAVGHGARTDLQRLEQVVVGHGVLSPSAREATRTRAARWPSRGRSRRPGGCVADGRAPPPTRRLLRVATTGRPGSSGYLHRTLHGACGGR